MSQLADFSRRLVHVGQFVKKTNQPSSGNDIYGGFTNNASSTSVQTICCFAYNTKYSHGQGPATSKEDEWRVIVPTSMSSMLADQDFLNSVTATDPTTGACHSVCPGGRIEEVIPYYSPRRGLRLLEVRLKLN